MSAEYVAELQYKQKTNTTYLITIGDVATLTGSAVYIGIHPSC